MQETTFDQLPLDIIQKCAKSLSKYGSVAAFRLTCNTMLREFDSTLTHLVIHDDVDDQVYYMRFLERIGKQLTRLEFFGFLRIFKKLERHEISSDSFVTLDHVAATCPNLRSLDISYMYDLVTTMESLASLRQLRHLVATNCGITSIASLSSLEKLEHLEIDFELIDKAEMHAILPKLTHLKKLKCKITDYQKGTCFEHCNKLEDLEIDSVLNSIDVSRLPTSLRKLELTAFRGTLDGLERLTQLEHLYAYTNDLKPLAGLQNMKKLTVNGSYTTLEPLSNMSQLETLSINGAREIDDLSPLSSCVNIVELCMENIAHVRSLQPLSHLKKLTHLYCQNSRIESLNGLEKCESLEKLDIQYTLVTFVAPILNLPNLHTLFTTTSHPDLRSLPKRVKVNPWFANIPR